MIIPQDIVRLSQQNPVIHHCVKLWQSGRLTWTQAMEHAVAALADQNSRLIVMATQACVQQPIVMQQDVPQHPNHSPKPE